MVRCEYAARPKGTTRVEGLGERSVRAGDLADEEGALGSRSGVEPLKSGEVRAVAPKRTGDEPERCRDNHIDHHEQKALDCPRRQQTSTAGSCETYASCFFRPRSYNW